MATDQTEQSLLSMTKDRNLRFPLRPRLAPDLHVFAMPDGLGVQVRGTEETVLLRGAIVESALPWLLSVLDGTRTVADLYAMRPPAIRESHLSQLLKTLFLKGLIVEPDGTDSAVSAARDMDKVACKQLLFLGRNVGITGANTGGEQAAHKLSTARLILIGNGLFGSIAADLLLRAGCENTSMISFGDDGDYLGGVAGHHGIPLSRIGPDPDALLNAIRAELPGCDLLITATRKAPNGLFQQINRLCLEENISWLRGNDAVSAIEIGPYVDPFNLGCFNCLLVRQSSSVPFAIEEELFQTELATLSSGPGTYGDGELLPLATQAAALLATEVTKIVTMIASPTTENAVISMSVTRPFHLDKFMKVPRCSECYRGTVGAKVGSNS